MLKIRGSDCFGSGYFGAPRGKRKHIGVDIVNVTGQEFRSLNAGRVTKLGYPYGDDLSFRYVQVTHADGSAWRYFYLSPRVNVGDTVSIGAVLGVAQDLSKRYPGITQHVHFEIMSNGDYIDPTSKLGALS